MDSPAVALARSPDVDAHGVGTIRGFRYRDGARGVNLDAGQDNRRHDGNDFATVFPTPRFPLALQQASAYYPTTDTAGLSPAWQNCPNSDRLSQPMER